MASQVFVPAPSPKDQVAVAPPVLVLARSTASGEQPSTVPGTKDADGGASTCTSMVVVPLQYGVVTVSCTVKVPAVA